MGRKGVSQRFTAPVLVLASAISSLASCGSCGSNQGAASDGGLDATTGNGATLTGSLDRAASGVGCDRGVAVLRAIDPSRGTTFDAQVAGDCTFSASIPSATPVFLQALDAGGTTLAVMAWLDPTRFTDGLTAQVTSMLSAPGGAVFDLGKVRFYDASKVASYSIGDAKVAGATGAVLGVEHAPTELASGPDQIPDTMKVGFPVGSDASGDHIVRSTPSAAGCTLPTTGMLYGEIDLSLFRPLDASLTSDVLQQLQANPSMLPPGVSTVSDGIVSSPIPARGVWVSFGAKGDAARVVMADTSGRFAIDASRIPPGVAFAHVYRNLGDETPALFVPLCSLGASDSGVKALVHHRMFPDGCTMDSAAANQCGAAPSASEVASMEQSVSQETSPPSAHQHHHHGGSPGATADPAPGSPPRGPLDPRSTCVPFSNTTPCCLDYDGTGSTSRPTSGGAYVAAYLGSTCMKYVYANCCNWEGGGIVDRVVGAAAAYFPDVAGFFGVPQLMNCWRNHDLRNCQNIDLEASGLVLSASRSIRDTHDPTTSPESITVECGTTRTLYFHNDTCTNTDYIALYFDLNVPGQIGVPQCGSINPEGAALKHATPNTGGGPVNQVDRDLVYTAPNHECNDTLFAEAWGMQRVVNISVVCDGGADADAGDAPDGDAMDDGDAPDGDAGEASDGDAGDATDGDAGDAGDAADGDAGDAADGDAGDASGCPKVSAFSAVFNQGCFCTTYTVAATDPAGGTLSYSWSNTNACGQFVGGNSSVATWYHPDSNQPGACPVEPVHSGIITAVITGAAGSVRCSYPGGSADGTLAQCVCGP